MAIMIVMVPLLLLVGVPLVCLVLLWRIFRISREHTARLADMEKKLQRELTLLRLHLTPDGADSGVRTPVADSGEKLPVRVPEPIVQPPQEIGKPALAGPAAAATPSPASGRISTSSPPKVPETRQIGRLEQRAREIIDKMWSWIVVGDECRPTDVAVEYAVATTWLLRIGIVILVAGMGFFLKYAVEEGLLPPGARVGLGFTAGAMMFGCGVRLLRGRYDLFGQGLAGGGLAVLYFSVFAAFQFYAFLELYTAFLLMVLITVTAGLAAVRFDSMLVAVLGIIGGYTTPLMLPSPVPDITGLSAYLLLLGIGVLAIGYWKNWRLLHYLSFICTYSWVLVIVLNTYEPSMFREFFPFLAAYFILFSTMSLLYHTVRRKPASLLEILFLLINAAIFFGLAFHLIANAFGQDRCAVLTLFLAAYYGVHGYGLRRLREDGDQVLFLTSMGLAAFFLAITIPIVFSPHWLTPAWAVQALIMLWLARKLDSSFLGNLACLLYFMVLTRFFFLDLDAHYTAGSEIAVSFSVYLRQLAERLPALGTTILATTGAAVVLDRCPGRFCLVTGTRSDPSRDRLPDQRLRRGFAGAALLMLFITLHLEFGRSFGFLYPPLQIPMLTLLWVALGMFFLYLRQRTGETLFYWGAVISIGAMLIKLTMFDLPSWGVFFPLNGGWEEPFYRGPYAAVDGVMRLFNFSLLIGFSAYTGKISAGGGKGPKQSLSAAVFFWLAAGLLLGFMTLELNTLLTIFVPGLRSGGISVLWSLFALAFIGQGIRVNVRSLRYTGLALFAVVAWRIFMVDLRQLEAVYRIVAFMALGVVVLAASLVYLKYRHVFIVKS